MNHSHAKFVTAVCIVCIFAAALFSFSAHGVVIIVHGSFASKNAWWRVQGGFFEAVEKQAKAKGHTLVPFSWSGQPNEKEINAAGAMLAKLIESYPITEHIILIGHSHGGNVINHASKLLFNSLSNMVEQPITEPPGIIPSPQLHWFDLTPTVKLSQNPETTELVSNKHYLIDRVYLLATPVSVDTFAPHMEVVGEVLNLFSYGDLIQPVLGLYQRMYPKHDRLINLEVILWDHIKRKAYSPDHRQMHASEIGRWLLAIPDDLKAAKSGGFERFGFGIDAKVIFKSAGLPEFIDIDHLVGSIAAHKG